MIRINNSTTPFHDRSSVCTLQLFEFNKHAGFLPAKWQTPAPPFHETMKTEPTSAVLFVDSVQLCSGHKCTSPHIAPKLTEPGVSGKDQNSQSLSSLPILGCHGTTRNFEPSSAPDRVKLKYLGASWWILTRKRNPSANDENTLGKLSFDASRNEARGILERRRQPA